MSICRKEKTPQTYPPVDCIDRHGSSSHGLPAPRSGDEFEDNISCDVAASSSSEVPPVHEQDNSEELYSQPGSLFTSVDDLCVDRGLGEVNLSCGHDGKMLFEFHFDRSIAGGFYVLGHPLFCLGSCILVVMTANSLGPFLGATGATVVFFLRLDGA